MDNTDWDKLLDEIGRYDNSPEITSEEIAQDDALHCHGALKTGHLWAAQKRPVVGN
jgi:hypothetical protein